MRFSTDCRYWRGDKPCRENRLCEGCTAYRPLGPKILLIKLGARGDVLRTTPLVAGLRKQNPEAHITWVTSAESIPLLTGVEGLDRLLALDLHTWIEVQARRFDQVICLDKDPWATGLAEVVRATKKMGWGMAPDGSGTICALNPEAEYSLALGVSNELKFKSNRKTYQEIIFEAVGLTYAGEPYAFSLSEGDRERCQTFLREHGIKAEMPILGLFTGCGRAFLHKRWTEDGFARLAERATREWGAKVLLISGPEEQLINERIRVLAGVPLLDTRGEHSIRELGGFLEVCRAVVTGDTLALHMALALRRPTVALFGPTCAQEIDMFGLGEKVVAEMECAPCYRQDCSRMPDCMASIRLEDVWAPLQRAWGSLA